MRLKGNTCADGARLLKRKRVVKAKAGQVSSKERPYVLRRFGFQVVREWRQLEAFTLLVETVIEGVRIRVVCHQPAGTNRISPA